MKTMLTRKQALRSAAALTIGGPALAGCGIGSPVASEPSAQVKTGGKILAYLTTNDIVSGARYFNETVFARFNKQFPQIKIEPVMGPNAEIATKTQVEVFAGTGPDLYLLGHPSIPSYTTKGAVKDISDYVKRDSRALTDVAAALDTMKQSIKDPQNRVWGTPATLTSSALVYNKALFDRLGVKPPDASLEWNPRDGGSFVDLAKRMTRPDQETWGFWWTGQITADILSFFRQNNATWLDATGTKADLLKPATFEACQFQSDLVNKFGVSPIPKNFPQNDNARGGGHWLFTQGKAAMFNLASGQESAWSRDLIQGGGRQLVDVQMVPLPKGAKRAAGTLGAVWLIAGYAKQPDLAWELMKWWSGDADSQAGVWTEWKWGLPPSRKAWADPRVLQSADNPIKNIKPFFEPFEQGNAAAFEINAAWSPYIAAFRKSFNVAMDGDMAMRVALETAQRDVQAVLDEQLPK
jgi:multiple sugar transport system substrate-binding protein